MWHGYWAWQRCWPSQSHRAPSQSWMLLASVNRSLSPSLCQTWHIDIRVKWKVIEHQKDKLESFTPKWSVMRRAVVVWREKYDGNNRLQHLNSDFFFKELNVDVWKCVFFSVRILNLIVFLPTSPRANTHTVGTPESFDGDCFPPLIFLYAFFSLSPYIYTFLFLLLNKKTNKKNKTALLIWKDCSSESQCDTRAKSHLQTKMTQHTSAETLVSYIKHCHYC